MHIDDLLNIIRREAERVHERRASGIRIGTVSSYDPVTHSVKLELQPDGDQTGWMPVATGGVGNGCGTFCGPTTGQAFAAYFQEGDLEAGIVIGRLANDEDVPVSVQSGEIIHQTPWGSFVKLLQDGSVTIQDKGGAVIACDGSGNITLTGKAGQTIVMDDAGNIILTPAGTGQIKLGGASAFQPTAKNTDAVSGGLVVATSTKVVSL